MNASTAAWILIPLVVLHWALRRRRSALALLLLVDVGLVVLPGRTLVAGRNVGAGVPGAAAWGVPPTVEGSPEQTDLPLQFAVWWEEVRRLAAQGRPPWVTDRIGGGTALYAHGQTGLPFPLQLPVWLLGAARGTDVMVVWKLLLGAFGAFALLRRLGARGAAAATAGVGYGFCLYALSWLVVPLTWAVAAAGWTFWALVGALRGRRRDAALLALLLGSLTGWSVHAETGVFLMAAVAAGGLVMAWGSRRRVRRLVLPLLLACAVAGVGALPTLAAVAGSSKLAGSRATPTYPVPWLTSAVRTHLIAQVVVPWRDGHPADGSWAFPFPAAPFAAAVGTVALALLLGGRVRRRHRRIVLAMAVIVVASAALEYEPPLLTPILARIPGLAAMTWVRALFLVPFGVITAAGLAADGWLRRPRPLRVVLAGIAVQLVVLAALLPPGPAGARRDAWPEAAAPSLLALLGPVLAMGGGWGIPALVLAESCLQGRRVLPAVDAAPQGPAPALEALERLVRGEPGRVLGADGALPANAAAAFGLDDLRAHDPVRSRSLARLHRALGATGDDLPGNVTRPWAGLAGAWGVRWLATPPGGVTGRWAVGWEEVWRGRGGRVYRTSRSLPIVRLAGRVVPPPGDPAEGSWEGIDFATTAVTEAAVPLGGGGKVQAVRSSSSRWDATVEATGPVLAILHVPLAPGWHAAVDGTPVPIRVVNLAAMAVEVPLGSHRVTWRYAPPLLLPGVLLTLGGLFACAWLWFRGGRIA